MRRSAPIALCVALLFGASSAGARTLAWTGTMTLDLGRLGAITQTGTGVATLGGTAGGILNTVRLAGGITAQGTAAIPVTDPQSTVTVITVVSAASVMATLGSGTLRGFASQGPLVWDALPMPGIARFCFLAGCGGSPTIDFTSSPGSIGVGLGGTLAAMGTGVTSVQLLATGWRTSEAVLFTSTGTGMEVTAMAAGFVQGATSMLPFLVDPGVGVLQIVTPTQFVTNSPSGRQEQTPMFTTLTIEFIPEPGKMVAAFTGVAAVALLAANRRRSSKD